MTIRQADPKSLIYKTARLIAIRAANQFPPSYLCENFEPHEWVVQAIADGIVNADQYMVTMTNAALQLAEQGNTEMKKTLEQDQASW